VFKGEGGREVNLYPGLFSKLTHLHTRVVEESPQMTGFYKPTLYKNSNVFDDENN
jgi:hypothetical protein